MITIATDDGTQVSYKDRGKGLPVLFSHGWSLGSDA
jgi:non-heme chloroperoxidase